MSSFVDASPEQRRVVLVHPDEIDEALDTEVSKARTPSSPMP
jgi:hypothetical protein